jgi:hypothetical protein
MKDIKHLKDCNVPVLCIWKGQMPSKTMQNVILYNFLPNSVIGFAATEKCTVINPVVECEPGPVDACPGCDNVDVCPENCDDPPEVEAHDCHNCAFCDQPVHGEPCDGCYDTNEWMNMPTEAQLAACDTDAPTPVADEAESLYKAGCWIALENRKHDLMSEWSLAAPDCKFQFESEDRDELLCSHDDHSLFPCHFDDCPRMRA